MVSMTKDKLIIVDPTEFKKHLKDKDLKHLALVNTSLPVVGDKNCRQLNNRDY